MKIRPVTDNESTLLRELRLRALRDAPGAFFSTLDSEAAEPAEFWERAARASHAASDEVIFVIDDERWLGMAGGFIRNDDPATAGLWGMWVDPVARRAGLGRRLLQAVIDWAGQRGALRLDTSVSTEAAAAHALYLSAGFVPTGKTEPLASNPALTEVFLSRALQP